MVKRESIRSPFKRQTVDNYRRKLQYLVFGNRRCPRNRLLALLPYFPELECFEGVLKQGVNKVGRDEVFSGEEFWASKGREISMTHRFYSAYALSWTLAYSFRIAGKK